MMHPHLIAVAPTGFETGFTPACTGCLVIAAVGLLFVLTLSISLRCNGRGDGGPYLALAFMFFAGAGTFAVYNILTPQPAARHAAITALVPERAGQSAGFSVVRDEVPDPDTHFTYWVDVDVPGTPTTRCFAKFAVNTDPTWTCAPPDGPDTTQE